MLSGPRIRIHIRTKARVRLVYILRVIDSSIERLMISPRSFHFPPKSLKFDLILSKITIVSLIEYQSMVKSAVIKNVSI